MLCVTFLHSTMLILDLGNAVTKATNTVSKQVFSVPTVVGYTTNPRVLCTAEQKTVFIGAEALKNRAYLTLQHPLVCHQVVDAELLEVFLSHLFLYEMRQYFDDIIVLVH